MEAILETILLQAPNLGVSILALFWASRLIEKLIDQQATLTDKILSLLDELDSARNSS